MDAWRVKKLQIVHMTIFPRKRVRSGFLPSPFLATTIPPTMKPRLKTPHRMPHTWTDTSRDYDYTDWEAVQRFAGTCADMVATPAPR